MSFTTPLHSSLFLFFFNDTATTEIYTLSLHDALPIYHGFVVLAVVATDHQNLLASHVLAPSEKVRDRKSTRLNSSHTVISYAVFCLKKKKQTLHMNSRMIRRDMHSTALSARASMLYRH